MRRKESQIKAERARECRRKGTRRKVQVEIDDEMLKIIENEKMSDEKPSETIRRIVKNTHIWREK